jgi:phosphatidylglycerophosphate synthase
VPSELSTWYPVKVACVFAAIAIVAALRRRGWHPFARFGPANQITTVRALLVAVVAGFIGEPRTSSLLPAIAAGTAATLLDSVDGWVARRTAMTSAFGARYDMEVDALLILALAILAWQDGKAGAWILASGLLRYLFVAAGWLWRWMRAPLPPTFRAKAICAVQIASLLLCLVPSIDPPASSVVAGAGLAALTYSFAVDIWRLRSHQSTVDSRHSTTASRK